jgi:hypothetical protein
MDRTTILSDMLSGVDPPPDERVKKSLLSAMQAFSDKQLKQMNQAGVRFWPYVKGAPPEYKITGVPDLGAPAEYKKEFRTIRISPASLEKSSITDYLRHELAHAWDDVRNETNPPNVRELKGDALYKELIRLAQDKQPLESQSQKKLEPGKLTLQEMLDRYVKVLPEKDLSFAHPSTSGKHAASNTMEFYAEGYSVFHGFNTLCQARLLRFAPELYDYLEKDSQQFTLITPDRAGLNKLFNETYPKMKDY